MKKSIGLSFLAVLAILFFSCKSTVPPVVSFTYEMKQDTAVFTNTTEGATSYSWNFGDNGTSTEQDPVHIYANSGTFNVTLTATNEGGSQTYTETVIIEKPIIKVDGSFSDWAEVTSDKLFTSTVADTATFKALQTLKVCSDNSYIYFYVKLDSAKVAPIDIFINSDNVATTGSNSWLWDNSAADYLIEGFLNVKMADATVFNFPATQADQTAWAWAESTPTGSGVVTLSKPKTVSGTVVEIEGKIIRELVTPNWASTIGFGIFTSGTDWSITGCLPGGGNKGKLLQVKL